MVTEIDAVVTRVIECWPINDFWMVEVEVMAGGEYLRTDITVSTKREARAIQPGRHRSDPCRGSGWRFCR